MVSYIRKIDYGKWKRNSGVQNYKELSADVITNCLKTSQNTLSLWQFNSDDEKTDALLAIVSGLEHLDTIDVIVIEGVDLNGFSLLKTKGRTPFIDFKNNHFDLNNLNYRLLGNFSEIVHKAVESNKVIRITRGKAKGLIKDAIDAEKLKIEEVSERILSKLSV